MFKTIVGLFAFVIAVSASLAFAQPQEEYVVIDTKGECTAFETQNGGGFVFISHEYKYDEAGYARQFISVGVDSEPEVRQFTLTASHMVHSDTNLFNKNCEQILSPASDAMKAAYKKYKDQSAAQE